LVALDRCDGDRRLANSYRGWNLDCLLIWALG
jgi:hypothetical protein